MHFVLLDSGGNLIESFDDEDVARDALARIVRDEPEAAADVALVTYDEHGHPVGDAITLDASGSTVAR